MLAATPDLVHARADAGPTRSYPWRGSPIDRLGEWLVRRGHINRVQLFRGLDVAYRHGCRLGDALVWLEVLDRRRLERESERFVAFAGRETTSNMAAAEP